MRMHQEGEAIQNGILQKSFIIRRYLELSPSNCAKNQPQENKTYIQTIETFHNSLKELSEYLSPPYVDDLLPLAIKSLLESWNFITSLCLIGVCYGLLVFGWWIPVVPAFLALILNGAVLASFERYDEALRSRIKDRQLVIDHIFDTIHSQPLQTLNITLRPL